MGRSLPTLTRYSFSGARVNNIFTRAILIVLSVLAFGARAQIVVTRTLAYSGVPQTFTVPNCVQTITTDVRGAQGGGNAAGYGGLGGRAQAVITVTPGEVLEAWVGGAGTYSTATTAGGFNGGGGHMSQGLAGTGGGASDIRRGSGLSNRIIVAGGGGGGTDSEGEDRPGGSGGGSAGDNGVDWSTWPNSGGQGATQTSGGAAGVACCYAASSGSFGSGGSGGGDLAAGAGGGGGWYGGGGGLFASGGGGSGYFSPSGSSQTVSTNGYQAGNGVILISYTVFPVPVVALPSLICTGSSSTLQASGMASYTWASGNNSSTLVVSPTVASTYSVEATTNAGCPAIGSVSVDVTSQLPSITAQQSDYLICPGQTVALTASGAPTFTWSSGVVDGQPFSPTVTTVYSVSASNVCGVSTATSKVEVNSVTFTTSFTNKAICLGSSITIEATGSAVAYTWSPFPTLVTGSLVSVSPTVTTVYTITGRNDYGCYGTAQVSVQVNPLPVIYASAGSPTVCSASSITLTASGANSYTWTPGILTGSSVAVNPTSSAVYTVTGSNVFGCKATRVVSVTVKPKPNVNAVASSTFICAKRTVTICASGAASYVWNTGATGAVICVSPSVTTTYSVTGYNSFGCSSTKTVLVGVMENPYSIPASTTACKGSTVALIAADGGGSYSWSTGECTQTITVKALTTTIFTFAVHVYSNNIVCSQSGTIQVIVVPNPTVSVAASKTLVCAGQNSTLTASGASTYTWYPSGSGQVQVVAPDVSSSYKVTGADANGCTSTQEIKIKVSACTSVTEFENNNEGFVVFPNPNNGAFTVKSSTRAGIIVMNSIGQLVYRDKLEEANNYSLTISGFASGVYYVVSEEGDGGKAIKVVVE